MTYLALIGRWATEENISLDEAKRRYPERLVLYIQDACPKIWQEWVRNT